MRNFIIHGTLAPRHREAGLELTEDDHIIELKHNSEVIARFSAISVKVIEIHKEADKWLKEQQHKTK